MRNRDCSPYKADNLSLMLVSPPLRAKSCGRGAEGRLTPVSAIAIFKLPSLTAAESVIWPPLRQIADPVFDGVFHQRLDSQRRNPRGQGFRRDDLVELQLIAE